MTVTLASFLDKGGTGKTTTTAHLGVALSEHGDVDDVLLIDLAGKQGDLSKHFGRWADVQDDVAADDDWPNISTVFQDEWDQIADRLGDAAVDNLILETGEGPDLIPAHPGLDGLDDQLGNIDDAVDRYSRLAQFLTDYVDGYDAVVIDLPGATNNVSINGLWAAGNVVTPVEMGPFEWEQVTQLRDDLQTMADSFDSAPPIDIALVLPNRFDRRTRLDEKYLSSFEDEYPNRIAPQPVPKSQDLRAAADDGTTAFALDAPSDTAERAMDAFTAAAATLLDRATAEDAEVVA